MKILSKKIVEICVMYLLQWCICSLLFVSILIFRQVICTIVELSLFFGFVRWSHLNGPPDVVNVCSLSEKRKLVSWIAAEVGMLKFVYGVFRDRSNMHCIGISL